MNSEDLQAYDDQNSADVDGTDHYGYEYGYYYYYYGYYDDAAGDDADTGSDGSETDDQNHVMVSGSVFVFSFL